MRFVVFGLCAMVGGCLRAESPLLNSAVRTPPPKAMSAPHIERSRGAAQGSPVQLGTLDGRTFAWVADSDASAVHVIDLDSLELISSLAIGGAPSELVMLRDGSLVVALRDASELVRITPGRQPVVRARIPVATEPVGLALANDDTLLVTSGWGRTLTAVSMDRFAREWTVGLEREPRSVVVSGNRALVSHAVGKMLDVVDLAARTVEKQELRGRREGGLQTTGFPTQGFALAKSATGKVFAPRALAQTERATDFGWMMPAVDFDLEGRPHPRSRANESDAYGGAVDGFAPETLDVAVLDERGEPDLESLALRSGFPVATCALPRAALATPDDRLLVACLGNDSVVELDGAMPSPHHVEIRRTNVPAGPTGLAWDEKHASAVVWSQFARQLSLIPAGGVENAKALAAVTMPPIDADPRLARGRALFHATDDARISKDGRACASCHPDGRDDGLVWQTKDGPRQTAMLSGRLAGTAPYGWLGQSRNVAEHLKTRTFRRLGGTGLPNDDLDALTLYVESLRPPEPKHDGMSELAVRGEAIFNASSTRCANCHGSDGRTPDGLDHSVWSKTDDDATGLFDTPSLRHVAQTAPYFHDGRYTTLGELLRKVDGTMGHTKQLSPAELEALEAYLVTR